jgi:phosphoribosyl 1,2-cyclic phosphate phosphodiesterase
MTFKFTILGCGSSFGVPRADGNWGKCNPKEVKNNRTRCSALISFRDKKILIDTSPDLRNQLIRHKITNIDAVLYSHLHADQTHGINDLRVFYMNKKKKIDVYADKFTRDYLQSTFSYCFKNRYGYPPILHLKPIKKNIIFKLRNKIINIKCLPVKHGPIESMSFIINNICAYVSDVSEIYQKDLHYFKNLRYFVIDCLRLKKHPSHFNLDQVLNLVKILNPKKTILTNLHSDLDYNYLLKNLPNNIIPGYDGLTMNIK